MNFVETHQPLGSTPAWPMPPEEPPRQECHADETPEEEEPPFVSPPPMPWPRILPGL